MKTLFKKDLRKMGNNELFGIDRDLLKEEESCNSLFNKANTTELKNIVVEYIRKNKRNRLFFDKFIKEEWEGRND